MDDTKVMVANAAATEEYTELSVEEAKTLKELLTKFLHSYGQKSAEMSDEEWLKQRFIDEMPEIGEKRAAALSAETIRQIKEYDENLADLNDARAHGTSAEEWFATRSREAAVGMSAAQFGRRMEELSDVLSNANAQLYRTVTTADGAISQQYNLDGFIAEQHHVNTFNEAAKLSGSPYQAEVCAPQPGTPYGKNSFDVVIRGKDGRIVHQYQMKYYSDAKTAIQNIKQGNYNNQTLVVPPEQVDEIKAAFPGKTVVSHIGGTEKVPTASVPASKEEVKSLQNKIQQTGEIPEQDWNTFDNRMLGKYVGRQAAIAGMQGAALTAGFHLVAKMAEGEPIEAEEVVAAAMKGGVDTGVKAAVSGAMITAANKGAIGIIPKGTPAQAIVNIACVTVENIKILGGVVSGELTLGEALDRIGCNTTAMYCGLGFGASGMAVGALALSWIPIAGPIIGGIAGGVIGYAAGSKFGEGIYNAVKNAGKAAVRTVKKMAEGVKNIGKAIGRGIKRLFNFA